MINYSVINSTRNFDKQIQRSVEKNCSANNWKFALLFMSHSMFINILIKSNQNFF